MKPTLALMLLAIGCSAISGCYSSTTTESQYIDGSQVYQTYTIDIDLDERMAQCEAIFTITERAGNKVALNPPASITVNGQPMDSTNDWGRSYRADIDPIASKYTFVYTDRDGHTYTNKVKVQMPSFPKIPDVITPNDTLSLQGWEDFKQFNVLTLVVKDRLKKTVSLSVNDFIGMNKMPLNELEELAVGPLTITLIYDGISPLQETTAVGGENMTYTVHGLIRGITLQKDNPAGASVP